MTNTRYDLGESREKLPRWQVLSGSIHRTGHSRQLAMNVGVSRVSFARQVDLLEIARLASVEPQG